MQKRIYIPLLAIFLTLFSNQAWSAPNISLGTSTGGDLQDIAIPIHFEAGGQQLATFQIDLSVDLAELTPVSITHSNNPELDFEIIDQTSIRIIAIPNGNNQEIASGQLGTLHFIENGLGLSKGQTITVSSISGFDTASTQVTPISTQNGFIAFIGDGVTDTDNDGISDLYEVINGLNPLVTADAGSDEDLDGLSNLEEYEIGSNINLKDTDGDAIDDQFEHTFVGLDPLNEADAYLDYDNDGADNVTEYLAGTYLDDSDTDNDGMDDGYELLYTVLDVFNNDSSVDSDGDNLTNIEEFLLGISPDNIDSDGDGIRDDIEASIAALDPADGTDAEADFDGDGLSNILELSLGTDLQLSNGTPITAGSPLAGQIISNSVLLADTTYQLSADVEVVAGINLIVAPGAKLEFSNGVALLINGSLEIMGLGLSPVSFTTNRTSPYKGAWKGIVVNPGATAVIDNAVIEWANKGIYFDNANGEVHNSVIQNNNTGIYLYGNSSPQITNGNVITANTFGIQARGLRQAGQDPMPVISGNSIYDNASYNFYSYYYHDAANVSVDVRENWWGTTDVSTMMVKIYDNMDTPFAPRADFVPFLESEGGISASGWVISGAITADTIVPAGETVDVMNDLIVSPGVSLTIGAGTELRFYGSAKTLQVDGNMQVQGTSGNPVKFTTENASPRAGAWKGIEVAAGGTVTINYAQIEWARKGINFIGGTGEVHNTVIRNNQYGIYLSDGASPLITNGNVISSNTYGIYTLGKNQVGNNPLPVVSGNSIYDNTGKNFYSNNYYDAPNVTLDISNNWWGTTDIPSIVDKIVDNIDYSFSPVAEFLPFLDSAGGTATYGTALTGEWINQTQLVAGATYDIVRSLTVPLGEYLPIPNGVTIRFYARDAKLQIDGSLSVSGTQADPARFTSYKSSPVKGSWSGVIIGEGSGPVTINGAIIEWADTGIYFDNSDGEVHGSTIMNNNTGIYVFQNSQPVITSGNNITKNNYGIWLYASWPLQPGGDPDPVIMGNNIFNNLLYNLYTSRYYDAPNVVLDVINNWWGSTDAAQIGAGVFDHLDNPN